MAISRRDIVQMLRDENELLKLRNQQVSDKLSRQQQAFRVLHEIDSMLNELTSISQVDVFVYRVLSLVLHACNSDNGSLLLLDETTDELVFAEVIGESSEQLKHQKIEKHTGIVGKSISSRCPELVTDVKKSDCWSSTIDETVGFSTKSLMCAPLLDGDRILGAIEVVNTKTDSSFDESDLNILSITARYVSMIILKTESIALNQTQDI